MYRLCMPGVPVISGDPERIKRQYTICMPEDEIPVFPAAGYVHSGGFVMREHNYVTRAGFRHLIILVYITMRQDYVTP